MFFSEKLKRILGDRYKSLNIDKDNIIINTPISKININTIHTDKLQFISEIEKEDLIRFIDSLSNIEDIKYSLKLVKEFQDKLETKIEYCIGIKTMIVYGDNKFQCFSPKGLLFYYNTDLEWERKPPYIGHLSQMQIEYLQNIFKKEEK